MLADLQRSIENVGLNALGIASPLMAFQWTSAGSLSENTDFSLLLSDSTATWMAPMAGSLQSPDLTATAFQERAAAPLFNLGGSSFSSLDIPVLRLFPQTYLRLVRLYAVLIEGRTDDRPQRPVPYYFAYHGATITDPGDRHLVETFQAGDELPFTGGQMTIHDRQGRIIDPIAVANIIDEMINAHNILAARDRISDPLPSSRQISAIAGLGDASVRIFMTGPHGTPYGEEHFTGATHASGQPQGIFTIPTLSTTIGRVSDAPSDLRFGPATNGQLAESWSLASSSLSLRRDCFLGMAVDITEFLQGDRPDDLPNAEPPPTVRHNEILTLAVNGNAALGRANEMLSGSPALSLVVAPTFQTHFALPTNQNDSQWPQFPTDPTPDPSDETGLPTNLRQEFAPSAHFIEDTIADVALTLNGLSESWAVRVFNRVFLPDAREGRGGGAGGVVPESQTSLTLILKDPLGIEARGAPFVLPEDALLQMDIAVIKRNGKARVFGNISTLIQPAAPAPSLPSITNALDTVSHSGSSSAGILGLSSNTLPASSGTDLERVIDLANSLGSEDTIREAPRHPLMARRDSVIASRVGDSWKAQISGMWFVPAARNMLQRQGSPGSPGGEAFQSIALNTEGSPLAYDLARAALRRTHHLAPRMIELSDSNWDGPSDASGGTVSAAVLQTIARYAETPELSLVASQIDSLPANWSDFISAFTNPSFLSGLPSAFRSQLQSAINPLSSSTAANRLYEEFKRDFSASVHGRRDAFWALKQAIDSAKNFIYIETPAISPTDYAEAPSIPENDLFRMLRDRMSGNPNLHAIFCLPKKLDYPPPYMVFAAREYARRKTMMDEFIASFGRQRVVAFHPIGFPGRPLRLTSTLVIVDDVWAMFGSSTLRRRGLTFDGGLDLVLFDRALREGRGVQISNLRRQVMAHHLGVKPPESGEIPHASWVEIADGINAAGVFYRLLDQGGAGLIEPIWDGVVQGVPELDPSSFPSDALADPDGQQVESYIAAALTLLTILDALPV